VNKWFKRLAKIGFALTLVVGLIHIAHMLTLDRIIEYREVTFWSQRWPAALDGYRIGFISDTHRLPDETLQSIVDELNARQLDLLLLGGDFSTFASDFQGHYRETLRFLSQVQAADGIFGVDGNHDDAPRLFAAMKDYGMVPLPNSGLRLHEGFYLAGVEDMWSRNPCIATAIANADDNDFVLLVTHNPDVSMRQDTTAVDLIVAGHTHGGQITFFGIWAPYFTIRSNITAYGQRFVSGPSESRDGVPVFVSNGATVDFYGLPRVFARPQIIVFTMNNNYN